MGIGLGSMSGLIFAEIAIFPPINLPILDVILKLPSSSLLGIRLHDVWFEPTLSSWALDSLILLPSGHA